MIKTRLEPSTKGPYDKLHSGTVGVNAMVWCIFCLAIFLSLGSVAEAQQAPLASELADQAYYQQNYKKCAELYRTAAEKAPLYEASYKYNEACCFALDGRIEPAFEALDKALQAGFRDGRLLLDDPDLNLLRTHQRWGDIDARCQAQESVNFLKHNKELAQLNRLTLVDRRRMPGLDAEVWQREMYQRCARVQQLVGAGEVHTSLDHIYAANILYYCRQGFDLELAVSLAMRANEMDPALPAGRMMLAATQDRLLWFQGKPQIYGSQIRQDKNGDFTLLPFEPTVVTDFERNRVGLPTSEAGFARVKQLNEQGLQLPQHSDLYEVRIRDGA